MTALTDQAIGVVVSRRVPKSPLARQLAKPVPPGKVSPSIARPALLKAPKITSPYGATRPKGRKNLGAWYPDYLRPTPRKFEIVEVTVDKNFELIPQLKGMKFSGSAEAHGWSHKIEQIAKAEYLIDRYPDMDIVYNIQAMGNVPEAAFKKTIEDVVAYLSAIRKEAKAGTSPRRAVRVLLELGVHVIPRLRARGKCVHHGSVY